MVLSSLPLAKVFPSGLNATLLTLAACPMIIRVFPLVCVFQRRMVLSSLPLMRVRPFGLKTTL